MELVPSQEGGVVITLKEITDLIDVQHSKAMKKVKKLAEEPSFGQVAKMDSSYTVGNGGVKTIETYVFNKKQAMAVSGTLSVDLQMMLVDRVNELEAQLKQPKELTRKEVLLLALELEEKNEQLLLENKELERTKAHISDKKTATALATASVKSRENEKLKQQLDKSRRTSTIRKQERRFGMTFGWHRLKKVSERHNLPISKVEIDEYEYNTYTAKAWKLAYGVCLKTKTINPNDIEA